MSCSETTQSSLSPNIQNNTNYSAETIRRRVLLTVYFKDWSNSIQYDGNNDLTPKLKQVSKSTFKLQNIRWYIWSKPKCFSSRELSANIGLSKWPIVRGNIGRHKWATITSNDLKRQGFSNKVVIALPILTPISSHCLPRIRPTLTPFDINSTNISSTSHIAYQYQIEIWIPTYLKLYSSSPSAVNPAIIITMHVKFNLYTIYQSFY